MERASPLVRRFDSAHHGSDEGDERGTDIRGLAAHSQKLAMAMGSDSQEARQAIGRLAPDHSCAVISIHETLLAVTGKLDAVKTRKEELLALTKVCGFITAASIIVVSRQQQLTGGGSSDTSKMVVRRLLNLGPLEECVDDLELLVKRLGKRRAPLLRRSNSIFKIKSEVEGIHSRVIDLTKDMGLAGVLAVFRGVLEGTGGEGGSHQGGHSGGSGGGGSDSCGLLTEQEVNLARLPVEQARVPSLVPARESWHVRRERVISTVLESLACQSRAGVDGIPLAGAGGGGSGDVRNAQRPQVVGLVGESGSGKTATAAEIVRSPEVLEYFSDGVVWLPVNEGDGSKARLPSLMHRLVGMVNEDIASRNDGIGDTCGEDTDICDSAEDSVAYVRGIVEGGGELRDGVRQQGRQLRCLVVADNVWEKEVVAKLRKTGMWVLLTSRKVEMIQEAGGHPVVIGRLVEADAVRVSRRAAELPSDEPSPLGAKDLAELCGRMALELSFVGRWNNVRGSKDPMAWQAAADNIRADLQRLERKKANTRGSGVTGEIDAEDSSACGKNKVKQQQQQAEPSWSTNDSEAHTLPASEDGGDVAVSTCASSPSSGSTTHDARGNRRRAVLLAGFRRLVDRTGGDDILRGLYIALAVLPDSHEFTAKDAAVLLHESHHRPGAGGGETGTDEPGGEKDEEKEQEEKEARKALKTLETRGILVPAGKRMGSRGNGSTNNASYRMHHAHWSFARKVLLKYHEIRGWAVRRWTRFLSSLDAVLFFDPAVLARLWRAVEDVGGTSWREGRPYETALSKIDDGDNLHRVCLVAAAKFRSTEEDWDGASLMWRRLLAVEHQAQEPNVMYPLWELVNAAEKNNKPQEAKSWRQAGYEALTQVMTRSTPMRSFFTGAGGSGHTPRGGSSNDPADTTSVVRSLTLNMARFGPSKGAEAEKILRRAVEIEVSRRGPDDTRVAAMLQRLGICVRQAGRLTEAEQLLKRALKIEKATLGEDDVQVAHTSFHLAVCLRLAGRVQDAEALLRLATKVEAAKPGGVDLYVARALHELGLCARLSKRGRQEEATNLFERALTVKVDKLGPDDPSVGQTLYELGVCFRQEGRMGEAEALFLRALRIKKATELRAKGHADAATLASTGTINRTARSTSDSYDSDNSEVSVALATFQLGVCFLQGGQRLDKAEAMLRSALAMEEERLGPEHLSVARIAFQLGVCFQRGGRRREAESMLMRCVKTLKTKLGADHSEVTAAYKMLDLCAPTE